MDSDPKKPWGPDNPHPLSNRKTELIWEGKYDVYGCRRPVALPAPSPELRQTEVIDPPRRDAPLELFGESAETTREGKQNGFRNLLIRGDNKAALAALLERFRGAVALIYIDPPFDIRADLTRNVPLNRAGGERQTLETVAYRDRWGAGADSYLHQMYERLTLMRDLLTPEGSLYLHCDWRSAGALRLLMDEVFGADCFQNEIVWCYREAINSARRWNRKHDTILLYTRRPEGFTFNADAVLQPHSDATKAKYRHRDEKGAYRLMGRGLTGSPIRSARDVSPEWEQTHPELVYRHYLRAGAYSVDYWQIDIVNQAAHERIDYATQKPERLLERIVRASSNEGDLIADLFCGSGTTAAVAERLGRRWIAADRERGAVQTSRKRLIGLQADLSDQGKPCRAFDLYTLETETEEEEGGGVPKLEAKVLLRPNGTNAPRVDVRLTAFLPSLVDLEPKLHDRAHQSPFDFLDSWSIDFEYAPDRPFTVQWHRGRTRKSRTLPQESDRSYLYAAPGPKRIAVKAVDLFGREVLTILKIEI